MWVLCSEPTYVAHPHGRGGLRSDAGVECMEFAFRGLCAAGRGAPGGPESECGTLPAGVPAPRPPPLSALGSWHVAGEGLIFKATLTSGFLHSFVWWSIRGHFWKPRAGVRTVTAGAEWHVRGPGPWVSS